MAKNSLVIVGLAIVLCAAFSATLVGAQLEEIRIEISSRHLGPVTHVDISKDGRQILTAGRGFAKVWDKKSGAQLGALRYEGGLAMFLDSEVMLVNSNEILYWDFKTSEIQTQKLSQSLFAPSKKEKGRVWTGHSNSISSAEFCSRHSLLLLGWANGRITCHSTKNRIVSNSWEVDAHSEAVSCVAISDDGKRFISGSLDDRLRIANTSNPKNPVTEIAKHKKGVDHGILATTISANGDLAASAGTNGDLFLWRISKTDAKHVGTFLGHNGSKVHAFNKVYSVAIAPDQSLVVSGGNDQMIRVWSVSARKEVKSIPVSESVKKTWIQTPNSILCLRFFNDSNTVLAGLESGIAILVDVNSGHILQTFGQGEPERRDVRATLSHDLKQLVTFGSSSTIDLWDLQGRATLRRLSGHKGKVLCAEFLETGNELVSGASDRTVRTWNLSSGRSKVVASHPGPVHSISISSDSQLIATGSPGYLDSGGAVLVHDLQTGREEHRYFSKRRHQNTVEFVPNSKKLMISNIDALRMLNLDSELFEREFKWKAGSLGGQVVRDFALFPDGRKVFGLETDSFTEMRSKLWTFNGEPSRDIPVDGSCVAVGPQGRLAAICSGDDANGRTIALVRLDKSGFPTSNTNQSAKINSVEFDKSGRVLVSSGADGVVKFWKINNSKSSSSLDLLCNLVQSGETWLITNPSNQFETILMRKDLFSEASWVVKSDPTRPLPIEIFSRDYFEPNLLGRILAGEKIPAPRTGVSKLNRVQPEIEKPIVKIVGDVAFVKLRVRATGNKDTFGEGKEVRTLETNAYDLRLFRDGQLVWQYPSPDKEPNLELSITTYEQLEKWRSAFKIVSENRRNVMVAAGDGWYEHTLTIPLPRHRPTDMKVEFSTYCFNKDRVKSKTRSTTVDLAKCEGKVECKAYIICMGVNASENRKLDLRFAADDAEAVQRELKSALGNDYTVFPKESTLISQYKGKRSEGLVDRSKVTATKRNLKTVLALLSGGSPTDEELNELPEQFRNLPKCTPDDLVIIYASTHGFTDPKTGMFYLFPYDVGAKGKGSENGVLKNCISSSELSRWLRDVDAAQHVLILDTCMSEGAVKSAGSEFKPGPFGSRGLGQLAYDKAMIVLAASQSDECAISHKNLKHGLLTYTLLQGLGALDKQQESPIISKFKEELTLDRLFQYAVDETENVYFAANAEGSGFVTNNEPWKQESKKELSKNWGTFARSTQKPVLYNHSNKKILLKK